MLQEYIAAFGVCMRFVVHLHGIVVVFMGQVTPASFSNKENQAGRLFEALYPRVNGPEDTRHFVEDIKEEDDLFKIASENVCADKFKDF